MSDLKLYHKAWYRIHLITGRIITAQAIDLRYDQKTNKNTYIFKSNRGTYTIISWENIFTLVLNIGRRLPSQSIRVEKFELIPLEEQPNKEEVLKFRILQPPNC